MSGNVARLLGVALTVMQPWRVMPGVPTSAPIRATRAEIALDAVAANAVEIRRVAGCDLLCVVKADAYGHGAVDVAKRLEGETGVAGFAVSLIEEGLQLRSAGVRAPILVMGPSMERGHAALLDADLTPLVSELADLEEFARLGRKRQSPVAVHLKVDTGMGRLGLSDCELERALERLAGPSPGAIPVALATHFACADEDDPADPDSATARQLARFADAEAKARAAFPAIACHLANSSGIFRFAAARRDLCRPGIALYGNGSGGHLRQVMRFVTSIAQIRRVETGQSVSYGALWTARRPSRIAVVPAGYADGLPRSLTGRGEALISGRRCPLVGAISMDMSLVDVTDLGESVAVGEEVVLLGQSGSAEIRAAEFAERAGLTEYEVTCGISKRVPRRPQ